MIAFFFLGLSDSVPSPFPYFSARVRSSHYFFLFRVRGARRLGVIADLDRRRRIWRVATFSCPLAILLYPRFFAAAPSFIVGVGVLFGFAVIAAFSCWSVLAFVLL